MALLPFLGAGQTPDADAKYAKEVKAGLDWLTARVDKESGSLGTNNMYAHAIGTIALCDAVTRVVHFYDGPVWHKLWNPKMRDLLIDLQVKGEGDKLGSWDRDQGFIGSSCGRIGTTALALLTLEVYYRYPPPKWLTGPEK
jgi:hypothetical protein